MVSFQELDDDQKEVVTTLDRNLLVIAGPGSGKCLHGESVIQTKTNYQTAKDLFDNYKGQVIEKDEEGKLYSVNGTIEVPSINESGQIGFKEIEALYRQKCDEIVKVSLTSGEEIKVSKSHPLFSENGWKSSIDFDEGDYIAVPESTPVTKSKKMDNKLAKLLAYQIAEGYEQNQDDRSKTVRITQSNREVLEELKNTIESLDITQANGSDKSIKPVIRHIEKDDTYSLEVYSNNYADFIENMGYNWGMKSAQKELPDELMSSDIEAKKTFIKNFFDAEGNIQTEKPSITFSSASRKLLEQLSLLMRELGIHARIRPKEVEGKKYYRLTVPSEYFTEYQKRIGSGRKEIEKRDVENNPNTTGVPASSELRQLKEYGLPIRQFKPYYSEQKNTEPSPEKLKEIIDWIDTLKEYNEQQEIEEYHTTGHNGKLELRKPQRIVQKRKDAILDMDKQFVEDIQSVLQKRLQMNAKWEKVESVEVVEHDDYIYDFTVEDNHNFIANGIYCHNTEMLIHRYNKLVEEDVHPEDIVLTTFGREASNEIEARVDVDKSEYDLNIGTIHSLCLDIIKKEHSHTPYSSSPQTIAYGQREDFAEDVVKPYIEKHYNNVNDKLVEDTSKVALKNIDKERRLGKEPEDSEGEMDFLSHDMKRKISQGGRVKKVITKHLPEIYEDYKKEMLNKNKIDYGGMINQTIKLFEENEEIRKQYDQMYRYIMVDEAQDINPLQWELIDLLAQDTNNLALIGDDCQNIYEWRGTDLTLMNKFKDEYDAKRILVETNYRSTQPIVDVINKINNELEGIEHKIMRSNKGETEKSEGFPKVKQADPEEVARLVKKNIKEEGYDPSEIAILSRTRHETFEYQERLEALGIPTQNLSSNNFDEMYDVQTAYGYVRTAKKQDDEGILNYLQGARNLWKPDELVEDAGKQSLWQFIQSPRKLKNHISSSNASRVQDDIDFIEDLEDEQYPFERLKETKFSRKRTSNLEALQEAYHSLGEKDFWNFMETDRDKYGTTVSTVHGAKGKQWKVVFVVGVNEGDFPREDTEEEKRVYYVATSRPNERLYITYNQEEQPSEFINMLAS